MAAPPPRKQFRKRERDSDDDEGGSGGARLVRPARAAAAAAAGTAASGKAATTFSTASAAGGGDAVRLATAVASDRSAAPHAYGGGAFATTEVDTAADRDGRALLERKLALQAEVRAAAAASSGGGGGDAPLRREATYRGLAGYASFGGGGTDAATAVSQSKVSGAHGPLRAPTHVRGVVRVDYQPDVCKDYKETGFCGFGDSCKFLHDRGDYKMGWQLDKEWEAKQAARAAALAAHLAAGGDAADFDEAGGGGGDAANPFAIRDAEADADGLPFACHICRGDFAAPVVTGCGHFFCERCATARYVGGDPYCAVCGKQTHGIFNASARLAARLARRAAGAAAGGDGAAGGGGGPEHEEEVAVALQGEGAAAGGRGSWGGWATVEPP